MCKTRMGVGRFACLLFLACAVSLATSRSASAAGDKAAPAKKVASFTDMPDWTTTYVSVQFGEMKKSPFFCKMLLHVLKKRDNHTALMGKSLRKRLGYGFEDIDRAEIFMHDESFCSAIRITTSKRIDLKKFLEARFANTMKKNGVTYYSVKRSENKFSYCVHVIDERTFLYFDHNWIGVLDKSWKAREDHPLRAAHELARKKDYSVVVAYQIRPQAFQIPDAKLAGFYEAQAITFTFKVSDKVHVDAMLRFEKPQRNKGEALRDSVDWLGKIMREEVPNFGLPSIAKASRQIGDSLKQPKVRQEGRLQHSPLLWKIDPETLGDAIEEILEQTRSSWNFEGDDIL